MDALHRLADQCDEAADTLTDAVRRTTRIDPPPSGFGVETAGRLAEVGGALREQWLLATDARQREAARATTRLTDLAAALRLAAHEYADADTAAARNPTAEA